MLPVLTFVLLQSQPLWQIGADGPLALAPDGYARYASDPLYIVGRSRDRDWPYVLPGPEDEWAGARAHRDDIAFGLAGVTAAAHCRLEVRLIGSHPTSPPRLTVELNGRIIDAWQAPDGASDSAVMGHPESGNSCRFAVDIPAADLRNGDNVLSLIDDRGSWVVYRNLTLTGDAGLRTVPVEDGIELAIDAPGQAILRTPRGGRQPIVCDVLNLGPTRSAELSGPGIHRELKLQPGRQTVELDLPPAAKAHQLNLRVVAGALAATAERRIDPVRPWTIYLMPHAHVDIGYTGPQADVLKLHERNLFDALAVARENRDNPPDSRFHFSAEATWVLDRLLQQASPAQRDELATGLRDGTLFVSAGYANLLTGLMNPEEMMQSFRYSRILGERFGADFDTVSQTDVPGVSWGLVVAMHAAGIRNLVLMPNPSDRLGGVHRAWRDRPFWWESPNGRERILVWQTDPYSIGHGLGWNGDRSKPVRTADPMARFIGRYLWSKLDRLARAHYPYDILAEPWSVTDNPPVDADVPIAARQWNARYVTPHIVLSTLHEACEALRKRYGARLPVERGDYTPYWEDGAGSTAAETAMNRATPNRLIQAEALFAMNGGNGYPAHDFREAWRNVLLFSEHTWGAADSISNPDGAEVKAEWAVKRGFATTSDASSRRLLAAALGTEGGGLEVRNTSSWKRTDLVRIPFALSKAGDRVVDALGRTIPSQRLRTGELAVLMRDVPPLAAAPIRIEPGPAYVDGFARALGPTVENAFYRLTLDSATGAVASLESRKLGRQLAAGLLDAYQYLPGTEVHRLQPNVNARIRVIEPGPLVATLRVDSDAPGARRFVEDVTLIAGLDRIELTDRLDKLAVREKEGLHFAFPFAVPDGQVRLGLAWAVVRPDVDQLAGANKNWMTTQGYADVSNKAYGITWSARDAPLVEVGAISANLLGGVTDPDDWRQHVGPTQTLYSWALNNHWHTNYKADQEGPLVFRYLLRAHGPFAPDAAARFGADVSQPLLVGPATGPTESLFTLSDPSVVATRVTPSDDGRALIVRLYGTTREPRRVHIKLRSDLGQIHTTDLTQRPGARVSDMVTVPGLDVLTLRIDVRRASGSPSR